MEQQRWIRVTNWAELQHYKDRDPPWIKLYKRLLDNYEYSRLQDASKSHLIGIWLLAARHDNRVPSDPDWIAQRIAATTQVDIAPLVSAGFIAFYDNASDVLANPAQDASNPLAFAHSQETEAETERETETEDRSRGGAPADQPATSVDAQDETAPPTAVASVEAQASEIIRAANRGMVSNDSIDADRFRPIGGSHGSRSYVLEWLQAGIPCELIRDTVAARAAAYQPSDTRKQITTMKYFDPAVRDEWERRQALPPPGSQAASVQNEYPGNGRADRQSVFVRFDDYDPEKEEEERHRKEAAAIAVWCRENPAIAAEIRDDIGSRLAGDPHIHGLPEGTARTIVESRIRQEIWERMQQSV